MFKNFNLVKFFFRSFLFLFILFFLTTKVGFIRQISYIRKINNILYPRKTIANPSKLAVKYLCGLNGIEIGSAKHNSFRLTDPSVCKKIGAFTNVDFGIEQGDAWGPLHTEVNIVALGDSLPFKDNTFDYVLSSHMIEHAFDPIKTIEEWFRVIKKGGYIFMIIPHKERTFDKNRNLTSVQELLDRNSGKIKLSHYGKPINKEAVDEYFKSIGRNQEGMSTSDLPHLLIKNTPTKLPKNWEYFTEDSHHHWSVWKTENFLDLVKIKKWKLIEYQDVDDKVGNGFTIILQK